MVRVMLAAVLLVSAGGTSSALAQDDNLGPRFANPVRVKAGEAFAGAKRWYPSPVLHDVNGDQRADLVVADLAGRVTFALRQEDGSFGAEQPMLRDDGKPLKFHNW